MVLFSIFSLTLNLIGNEKKAGPEWWSLQPIKQITPPKLERRGLALNQVDAFIQKKLTENKLAPSKPASPRTQIRRLYFDLIGIPPAPEKIAEFENNPSDKAYEKIVDTLLKSKHYGERWGRHWLDIARFGESDGFERNNPRNSARNSRK